MHDHFENIKITAPP